MKKTTATYPNRIKEKQTVENKLGLPEFSDELGQINIYSKKKNILISSGYNRIVYGDGGAYVELEQDTILFENLNQERGGMGYYDKFYTEDRVLVYKQRVSVEKLPNPPKGKHSVNNNCKEGYADYKIGQYYVSVYDISIDGKTMDDCGQMKISF